VELMAQAVAHDGTDTEGLTAKERAGLAASCGPQNRLTWLDLH
jgi:hypothetical protein